MLLAAVVAVAVYFIRRLFAAESLLKVVSSRMLQLGSRVWSLEHPPEEEQEEQQENETDSDSDSGDERSGGLCPASGCSPSGYCPLTQQLPQQQEQPQPEQHSDPQQAQVQGQPQSRQSSFRRPSTVSLPVTGLVPKPPAPAPAALLSASGSLVRFDSPLCQPTPKHIVDKRNREQEQSAPEHHDTYDPEQVYPELSPGSQGTTSVQDEINPKGGLGEKEPVQDVQGDDSVEDHPAVTHKDDIEEEESAAECFACSQEEQHTTDDNGEDDNYEDEEDYDEEDYEDENEDVDESENHLDSTLVRGETSDDDGFVKCLDSGNTSDDEQDVFVSCQPVSSIFSNSSPRSVGVPVSHVSSVDLD